MGLRLRIVTACLLLAGLSTAIVVVGVVHPKLARYAEIDVELGRTGLQAANLAADYVETRVGEASRRVRWLAAHEHLTYRNHAEARALLVRLRGQAVGRPPMAVLDEAGRVVASADPTPADRYAALPLVAAARKQDAPVVSGRVALAGGPPAALVATRFKYYDRQGEHWGVVLEGLDLAAWDRALNAQARQVEVFDRAGQALVPPGGQPGGAREGVRRALAGERGTAAAEDHAVRAWAPAGTPGWAAVVTVPGARAYLPVDQDVRRALAAGGLAMLVALLLAIGLSRYLLAPLRRLEAGADALARGDWAAGRAALPTRRTDELGRLAARFEAMAGELHGRFASIEALVAARTADLAQANARLATAVEDLQALDELKRAFLDAVSHELRTPLNFIMGYGSTMADGVFGDLTPAQAHALVRMLEGADRLLVIVDDLLEIAKLEAGQRALAPAATDVGALLVQAAGELDQGHPGHGLAVRVAVPPALPPAWADPEAVGVVLRQLVSNAAKFTPPGGRLALTAEAAADHLLVEVQDTGCGIGPEALPHIWESFRQGDGSMTRRHGGTGVGLAIVKRLVEAMGGTVACLSAPGQGARFRFTLPRAREAGPLPPAGGAEVPLKLG